MCLLSGVRQSNLSAEHNKLSTRIVIRLCALLSGMLPSQIISNSDKARYVHIQAGYNDKFSVIPNGFDTQVFLPDSDAVKGLRAELSIPPESVIVGMVGRFDSQKIMPVFLRLPLSFTRTCQKFIFVLLVPVLTQPITN